MVVEYENLRRIPVAEDVNLPCITVAEDVNLPDAEPLRLAIPCDNDGQWLLAIRRNFHKFRYVKKSEMPSTLRSGRCESSGCGAFTFSDSMQQRRAMVPSDSPELSQVPLR
jgi:hypothetical protein